MATALPIVTLVIFIILINPITFCLFKHGRHGILGWATIQIFCGIRIVGSIIQIQQEHTHSTDKTTVLLLNNIGLSPLLLAALGVLHEARTARNPNINTKFEWVKVLNFHGLVIGGMVLIIIGIINQISNKKSTSPIIAKIGMVILLLSFCILYTWVLWSLRSRKSKQEYGIVPLVTPGSREPSYGISPASSEATMLLYGLVSILPFIGIRDIYAALGVFLTSPSFKNNQTAKIILSVVPEMIVTTVLAVVGVRTRHISRLRKVAEV